MKKEDNKRTLTLIGVLVMVAVFFTVFLFSNDENLKKQVVQDTTQMAQDLVTQNTYNKEGGISSDRRRNHVKRTSC